MAFTMRAMGSARSAFSGHSVAFSGSNVRAVSVVRPVSLAVEAKKVCDLTGVKRNKANSVSFSNKKSRKWQDPNLQHKKVYWAKGQRWVTLKLCTRAIKTIEKNGLDSMAAEAGIDLWKLPFKDVRPERLQYLAENKGKVPVRVNPRAMKNPVKLAASKKLPKYPAYDESGKIIWIRQGMEAAVAGSAAEPGAAQPSGVKITVKE
ncbi:plastid ribosomal protein L28 [Haematococcus lacustris]